MASFSLFDKIQKIPTKTRLFIFCGLIVVLLIVYIVQFQIPMNTQITQLKKSLSDLKTTIQANDAKIRKLDDLRTEVKGLQARLVVLTEQLPPGSEVSGLLLQIQKLVNQSGLILKLWKPDKQKPHPSGLYEEIPISLALTGGYHNTALLFDRISKLTRIVNILNIKMGNAKVGKGGNVDVDITCTAMTFAAAEKKVEPTPKKGKKVQ
jgi:type IV pilus assembly protein PilO